MLWRGAVQEQPAATLDFTAYGNAFTVANGSPLFANAGTLRKTARLGNDHRIPSPCAHAGSVQANSGMLTLTLADSTGDFTVARRRDVKRQVASPLSRPVASITGAGNFTVTAGSLTNYGAFNIGGTNTFSVGTAVFAGACTLANNALVVNGGSVMMTGSGTVAPLFLPFPRDIAGQSGSDGFGSVFWSGGTLGSSGTVLTANGGLR